MLQYLIILLHRVTMKKRYLFGIVIILIAFSFFFEQKQIHTPEKTLYLSTSFTNLEEARNTFSKHKPIILWDLHDCLFERPPFSRLRRGFWNIENKPQFFYEYLKALFNKQAQQALQVQRDKPSYVPQAYFEPIRGYTHLYTELNKFVNNVYRPNKKMFALVKELHESGYQQYLFSNIGPVTLSLLQQDYPHYFVYFDRLQNVINSVTPPQDQWVQKPEKKAFQKALSSVDKDTHPENVIFIDDRQDNVKLAQNIGMNGIVFATVKQLHEDLNQLITLS